MAKLPDYKAKDFDERLAALTELADKPKELCAELDDFMKFLKDPAADCDCKLRQARKLKKACRKALGAVAELGEDAVSEIMSRAGLLTSDSIRMLRAVPVEAIQKWIAKTLSAEDESQREKASGYLNAVAIDFQGRVALSKGGGVLASIVSGPPAKPALLVALAKDNLELFETVITSENKWIIRSQIARAMSATEPSEQVVELLIKAAKDEEESVREAAIYSLGKMEEAAVAAVPVLIDALKTASDLYAADALGEIGPAAKEAIPALKAMMKKSDPAGKEKAKFAIAKIKA